MQLKKLTAFAAAFLFFFCLLLSADPVTARLSDSALLLPAGKASAGTFRFAVLGDAGTGKAGQFAIAKRLTQFLGERPFDTVLMLGDNIYSSGSSSDIGKKFEQPYAELLKQDVKFYAVLGNHDVRRGRAFQTNYSKFNMGGKCFYSFTNSNGLIEFFALDSTAFDEKQRVWLETALTSSKARWKIAYFHHPLYSSGRTHGSDDTLRATLEPLFIKHGVTAALSGHDHFYERIKPQSGIQYFVSGASGQLRPGNINRRSPLTEASNDTAHSFMFAEASKDNLNFWAVDAAGNILDSVSLKHSERRND